jgi:hypothetical protein
MTDADRWGFRGSRFGGGQKNPTGKYLV